MFSYYGSKSKIVDYYPPPKHKKIIEPFAGSARYSLKYWQNDVLLVDKYEVIYNVWKYIQTASKKDILSLPSPDYGDTLVNYDLSDIERNFLGFLTGQGFSKPQNSVTKFATLHERGDGRISTKLKYIANNKFKIKHWDIKLGSYDEIENKEATWFIDPPYQFGGEHYVENTKNIDFAKLAKWCKTRNGQVIVCENSKADWLPFKEMTKRCDNLSNAHKKRTVEVIWSNHKTNYDAVQQSLQF
jgi:site-specific DNA-adenine methylase